MWKYFAILAIMDDFTFSSEEELIEFLSKYTADYTHALKSGEKDMNLKRQIDAIVFELACRKTLPGSVQSQSDEISLN